MDKYDRIIEYIDGLEDEAAISLWNSWAGSSEEHIYSMDEFDEVMKDYSPLGVAELVSGSANFDTSDEYFKCSCWGIESGDCWRLVEDGLMAEDMVSFNEDFGSSAIREILESEDNDDC